MTLIFPVDPPPAMKATIEKQRRERGWDLPDDGIEVTVQRGPPPPLWLRFLVWLTPGRTVLVLWLGWLGASFAVALVRWSIADMALCAVLVWITLAIADRRGVFGRAERPD
jgi:hypothetical protein